jgi:hypothetical protein
MTLFADVMDTLIPILVLQKVTELVLIKWVNVQTKPLAYHLQ